MIPGPDIVVSCPYCQALHRKQSFISGNTFGRSAWSDMKVDSPMMPDIPAITRCIVCQEYFWLKTAREVGTFNYDGTGIIWGDKELEGISPERAGHIPLVRHLQPYEYKDAISQRRYKGRKQKQYLLIRLWWSLNDLVRDREDVPMDDVHQQLLKFALEELMVTITPVGDDDFLQLAEMLRELGDFRAAKKWLVKSKDPALAGIREQMAERIRARDRRVFRLAGIS